MVVKEKLIELLTTMIFVRHGVDPAEAIADFLIDNGVTIQKWIPVEEKLPENGQQVIRYHGLAWNPKKTAAFYYEGDEKLYGWSDVTHWWPVPEAPKEV